MVFRMDRDKFAPNRTAVERSESVFPAVRLGYLRSVFRLCVPDTIFRSETVLLTREWKFLRDLTVVLALSQPTKRGVRFVRPTEWFVCGYVSTDFN